MTGRARVDRVRTSPKIRSFQTQMKMNRTRTATEDFDRGKTKRQRTPMFVHPSMRAASPISRGTVEKDPRKTNTLKGMAMAM